MYDCTNEVYIIQDDYGTLKYELYNPKKTRRLPHSVLDAKSITDEMGEDIEIMNGLDLFVIPKRRNMGIATKLIGKFIKRGKNSIILINAGVHAKEYPVEPSDEDMLDILDEISNFYTKKGFCDINSYIGGYQFQRTMIYPNKNGLKLINYLKRREINEKQMD